MEAAVLEFIRNMLDNNPVLVYILFNISCMLQMLFPPYPGDIVLVFQGYVTTRSTIFHIVPVFLNAMLGTFTGSFIIYRLGHAKGDEIFNHRLVKRYFDEKHKSKSLKLFDKYGSYAVFMGKFIPGVNSILILVAGILKFKPGAVYISMFISIFVHHTILVLLGKFLGHNLEFVKSLIKTYNIIVAVLAILLAAGFAAYKIIMRRKATRI